MEYKAHSVNAQMKCLFDLSKEGLATLGQKMPPIPEASSYYLYSNQMADKFVRLDEVNKKKKDKEKKHRDVS